MIFQPTPQQLSDCCVLPPFLAPPCKLIVCRTRKRGVHGSASLTVVLFVLLRLQADQKRLWLSVCLHSRVLHSAWKTMCLSVKQASCLLLQPTFSSNKRNILSSSFSTLLPLILLVAGNWQRMLIIFPFFCCAEKVGNYSRGPPTLLYNEKIS